MEILPILTVEELKEWTANSELEELCDSDSTLVEKYIKQVSALIRTQIDKEQFKDWDDYDIPESLKLATIRYIDSYYDYIIVKKTVIWTWKRTSYSETIDDYKISETYSENTNTVDFFGVPIDKDTQKIFLSFMPDVWFWKVNLH